MGVEMLDIAEPFFAVRLITDQAECTIDDKAILLNLSKRPVAIQDQSLAFPSSVIVANTPICGIECAVLVERFSDCPDEQALFDQVRQVWPLAFDVRKEERLRGVSHYLSPKVNIGNLRLSMCHSGSVPLIVGLHRDYPFCDVPGFKEVHTQIVGCGKMLSKLIGP